jgi:hypothetical protein
MLSRSSFGQGSSGRGMARAIAKVAQVLADASAVASAGQTRTYELYPFNARDLAPLILQRLC